MGFTLQNHQLPPDKLKSKGAITDLAERGLSLPFDEAPVGGSRVLLVNDQEDGDFLRSASQLLQAKGGRVVGAWVVVGEGHQDEQQLSISKIIRTDKSMKEIKDSITESEQKRKTDSKKEEKSVTTKEEKTDIKKGEKTDTKN